MWLQVTTDEDDAECPRDVFLKHVAGDCAT